MKKPKAPKMKLGDYPVFFAGIMMGVYLAELFYFHKKSKEKKKK